MRIGTARDQLLLEMDAARDRVSEAIAGLSEEQIARPDLDGWSVKDHLTHLTLWHELRFFEELGPNGAGHETSHADMIAAWRKREGI